METRKKIFKNPIAKGYRQVKKWWKSGVIGKIIIVIIVAFICPAVTQGIYETGKESVKDTQVSSGEVIGNDVVNQFENSTFDQVEYEENILNDEPEIDIESTIDKIKVLVYDKNYYEANNLIEELLDSDIDTYQRNELEELREKIDIEINGTYISVSQQDEYLNKCNDIDNRIVSESLSEIEEAKERLKVWDDLLNEIYSVLKEQLPENQMSKLQEEQIEWITYRDNKAEDESSYTSDESMREVYYTSSLAYTTRDRCYYLINYMN